MIKLYHYSNTDIKDKLKIDFYGSNYYTNNDLKITTVKRLFFYTEPSPEFLLSNCKFLYTVNYPNFRIYDISQDKRGYLINRTISKALYKIKQKYNGISYKIGNYTVVNLFYNTRFIKKEVLK